MRTIFLGLISAALAFSLAAISAQASVVLSPELGYGITHDGNDGDFFSAVTGTPVPDNAALASNGAIAFGDAGLVSPHTVSDLNNGLYGNTNSWIGGPGVRSGIILPGLTSISSIAWGRDNGADSSIDCCTGQLTDRSLGLYTLYHTLVASPGLATNVTGNTADGWRKIGTFNYVSNDDFVVGGGFSAYLRHEYQLSFNGQAILATAFRLDTFVGAAIDEIELYAVPEPATLTLFGLGLLGLGAARRRHKRAA